MVVENIIRSISDNLPYIVEYGEWLYYSEYEMAFQ